MMYWTMTVKAMTAKKTGLRSSPRMMLTSSPMERALNLDARRGWMEVVVVRRMRHGGGKRERGRWGWGGKRLKGRDAP